MRYVKSVPALIAALGATLAHPSLAVDQAAPAPAVVAHSVDVSRSRAALELQLANDQNVRIVLARGEVRVNDNPAGTYVPGGQLETAWRALLDSAGSLNSADLLKLARHWSPSGLDPRDRPAATAIASAFTTLTAVPAAAVAAAPAPPATPVPPPPAEEENPNPHRHAVAGEAVERSTFAGIGPSVAGLFGAFVALASIAFGLMSFAPRQLDIVSDTVRHSFVRSFFAGLFAQPLLLPALGVLCVGLALTVVGILVIPVAIAAFVALVAVTIVGGYIATARTLGENYQRRRMSHGASVSADPVYRAILVGLAGLLVIWVPFALLGWIRGLGQVLFGVAMLFTWVMATVGLGATILSRAGLRASFGQRFNPQVSGELSWSTVDEIAPSRRTGERSNR